MSDGALWGLAIAKASVTAMHKGREERVRVDDNSSLHKELLKCIRGGRAGPKGSC